jgi:transaldolase
LSKLFVKRENGRNLNPLIDTLSNKIEIYSDVKNLKEISEYRKFGWIKGFTSNPSLIRAGGSKDYVEFIEEALPLTNDLPFSVEVISDDLNYMKKQALFLHSLGKNIFVKIPITNTNRLSTIPLILDLLDEQVKVNITAVMTLSQVEMIYSSIPLNCEVIISIFAGRIADTGIDPVPFMKKVSGLKPKGKELKLLWASPREILNIFQAIECGIDIITATPEVLKKYSLLGKDLDEYSLETVKMFYEDATSAGYRIPEIDY